MFVIARNSAWVCRRTGAVAAAVIGGAALAQPGNVILGDASWHWEISTDSGATWREGVVTVGAAQAFVDVRARCTFEQREPTWFYGGVFFDGLVRNAGPGDSVADVHRGGIPGPGSPAFAGQRFGDVIKIDDATDLLPAGLGPRWLSSSFAQGPPTLGVVPDFSNPYAVFTYRLLLDGTRGEREISAVFDERTPSDVPAGRYVRVWNYRPGSPLYFQTLHETPSFVRVIPGPGTAALVGMAMLAARRQRRETGPA